MVPEKQHQSTPFATVHAGNVLAEGRRILAAAAQSLGSYSSEVGTPVNKGPAEQQE